MGARVCLLLGIGAGLAAGGDDRWAKDVGDPLLQRRINEAIERGVAYLKAAQKPGGHWAYLRDAGPDHPTSSHVGGITALALYALAASGVPADDPAIVAGLGWIGRHPEAFRSDTATATYSISLLVLALTRIDPVAHRRAIHERAHQLLQGQQSDGMWTYACAGSTTAPPARAADRAAWRKAAALHGMPDHSNTQFAVLALWAASSLAAFPVPEKAWEKERKHFLKAQTPEGGWSYRMVPRKGTPTMTAAGIVALVYAMAALDDRDGALERARQHPAVRKGLAALPDVEAGRWRGYWMNYYWTYSLERVGTVLNLPVEDWYVPGARHPVAHPDDAGRWPKQAFRPPVPPAGAPVFGIQPKPADGREPENAYETSLALLFLTRGTLPPIKGVITESGRRGAVVITKKEEFPDPSTAEGLERAFGHYHAYKPEDRAAVLHRFGAAGTAAPALFVAKLRDADAAVRATAYDLLTKLLDKPLLFDPHAGPEDRAVMLAPIDSFWRDHGADYAWDAGKRRFAR